MPIYTNENANMNTYTTIEADTTTDVIEVTNSIREENREEIREEIREKNRDDNREENREENRDVNRDEETEHTCSLCCDIILPDQVIQTPCPYSTIHVFHKECFVKFRKNEYYNNRCPNCRSNITLKQMIPKGTCNRLKESSQILDYEQQKLQTLLVEHKTIEMNIRNIISQLNIDISNIFKEKIVIKNNKSKLKQLNWRIEQKQIKQNLEKKNHKKYILELLKVIEDYEPNYYNSNTYLINQKNRINNLIIE